MKKNQKKSPPLLNKKQTKIAIIIAAVILIFLFFFTGSRNLIQLIESSREKKELIRKIDEMKKRKAHLDSIKYKLENDPEYIEKIAREKYNMKKKGEKIYKIIEKKD
jgi:cell division protein FtsB